MLLTFALRFLTLSGRKKNESDLQTVAENTACGNRLRVFSMSHHDPQQRADRAYPDRFEMLADAAS